MYAVIETGGKQYRVELLKAPEGEQVTFENVLLVGGNGEVKVGQPVVEGATVTATSLGEVKGPKVIIFKHSGRTTYRRKTGHRQRYTRLRVDSILA